ncbi:hypothetical protein D9758_016979 [Tetrapyrgos nigripes]|uniref:Uncharacterized protein n=1 Tax=Tetrapyrgos nigripes TaxID=182062 RepID=A0A8H5C936_9AGAR|nr:hypothetical protein D9758_016979 [Tetrapyrgos nigripes]
MASELAPLKKIVLGSASPTAAPGSRRMSSGANRYNHKHVPVRLHHLKSFLSGVRHSVSNSQTPSWSISTISTTFLPSHMNPKPVYVQTVLLEKPH